MRSQRADEDHFEVSETLTLPIGNHSLKTGFNFLRIGSITELERYSDGVLFSPPTGVEGPLLFWQNFTGPDAEMPWCTTPIEAESSLGPDSHHPIISLSGIPSAVIVLRILHPILASTLCAANPLARIAEPTIAL